MEYPLFVCPFICLEFFSGTTHTNFLIFCVKLELFFLISFWGSWDKSAQMRFVMFYEKLMGKIFLIFSNVKF